VVSDLTVKPNVTIPAGELQWRFSHAGGPGGQGVNTSDSRVELSWDLAASAALPPALKERARERLATRLIGGTTLTVVAAEFRAQLRNREAAAARLCALVAEAIAPPPRRRRATRPTAAAVERRIEAKKRRGQLKRSRRAGPD
jgi:ribosome-associated protein